VQTAGPAATEWVLYDQVGSEVLVGAIAPGAEWRPYWPSLRPGSYRLWLRQGTAETVHPVVVLGRPVTSAPDAGWQTPAAN
jgi:hypothetical protein